MNWLGIDARGFFGAILGSIIGAFVFFFARVRGVELPPVVGLAAGLGAMVASRETSGTRGIIVGSIAVWACAIAEVKAHPIHGLGSDLFHFSDRVGFFRFLAYAACAILAILLGGRAAWSSESRSPASDQHLKT